MSKPFRSMARVGVLPDFSRVRPTGALVALPLPAALHTPDSYRVSLLLARTPRAPQTIARTDRNHQYRAKRLAKGAFSYERRGRCPGLVPTALDGRAHAIISGAGDAGGTLRRLPGTQFFLRRPSHRPVPFKAASNAVVAEEHAPRALGPQRGGRASKTACTHILVWPTGLLVRDRGPDLLIPLPHPCALSRLEYADGPADARTEGFRPAVRRSGLHLYRLFALASRKGGWPGSFGTAAFHIDLHQTWNSST